MDGANITVDVGNEDEVSAELDEGFSELEIVSDAWTWVVTARKAQ